MNLSGSKRAEVMGAVKNAADKAGSLVMATLAIAGAALLVAVVSLVVAVRVNRVSA